MRFKFKGFNVILDESLISENKSRIVHDLKAYSEGNKFEFNYELDLSKFSEFEQNVWREMRKIPYGKTVSYQELAQRIGNPKACRAVGNAVGKNPIVIILPCHRVVGKNSIGGFTGPLELKKELLNLEKEKRVIEFRESI